MKINIEFGQRPAEQPAYPAEWLSINTVLFWLVPIFYGFESIPRRYVEFYQFNPVAALVLCMREILLRASAPPTATMLKLGAVAFGTLAVGTFVFRRNKDAFYEHI